MTCYQHEMNSILKLYSKFKDATSSHRIHYEIFPNNFIGNRSLLAISLEGIEDIINKKQEVKVNNLGIDLRTKSSIEESFDRIFDFGVCYYLTSHHLYFFNSNLIS
jgi:hypothetical protein